MNYIKRSVIENIDVNYAPNGWAAHEDGAPVQTTITIQFKEMLIFQVQQLIRLLIVNLVVCLLEKLQIVILVKHITFLKVLEHHLMIL